MKHTELDNQVEGGSEAACKGRRKKETGKDGSETLSAVPAPDDGVGTTESDTRTRNGRDD